MYSIIINIFSVIGGNDEDTWSHERGSPSPIVQIQEYLASALQSRDENFIIHHTSASPWI